MKREKFLLMLTASLLAFSCSKLSTETNPTNSGGQNSSSETNYTDDTGSDIIVNDENDDISTVEFTGTVQVVYSSSGATVTGAGDEMIVTVSGCDVTITYDGEEPVVYELSGSSSDGFFKLYSSNKQSLTLKGLSLTNPDGAAINIQSHKSTYVVVEGVNTLADGSSYSDEVSSEDMKAAFFSEGQLLFSGSGSLTVNATGKSGITSDDYIHFMEDGPTVKVTSSAGHGVRGKESIIVSGGDINVSVSGTGKKGFSSDGRVYFSGGNTVIKTTGSAGDVDGELTGVAGIKADLRFDMDGGNLEITCTGTGAKGINCDNVGYFNAGTVKVTTTGSNYGSSSSQGGMPGGFPGGRPGETTTDSDNSVSAKGIKFDGNLYFAGSDVTVKCSSHEGIESKGTISVTGGTIYSYASDDAINAASDLTISGGYVCGYSTGNDGIDANGDLFVKGGVVVAVGSGSPEVGLDANTEENHTLYIQGGTVISFGGIEDRASISQGCITTTWSSGVNYALYDGSDLVMAFTAPSSGGNGLVMSDASLKSGSQYTLLSGAKFSGGTEYFGGYYIEDPSVSGGSSTTVTASNTSSSSGQGGQGGQGGPGGRGGR